MSENLNKEGKFKACFAELIDILENNEEMAMEFGSKKNLDELYEFTTLLVGEHSKEELAEFLKTLKQENLNSGRLNENQEKKLSKVAGGATNPFAKFQTGYGVGTQLGSLIAPLIIKKPTKTKEQLFEEAKEKAREELEMRLIEQRAQEEVIEEYRQKQKLL